METEPGVEFEFYLATKLHKTVGEMRRQMTQVEYVHWQVYYGREAQRKELAQLQAGGGG